jgi:hypothetical protein
MQSRSLIFFFANDSQLLTIQIEVIKIQIKQLDKRLENIEHTK